MDPSSPAASTGGAVQLKIWLHGISPMVWRRLQVADTCALRELCAQAEPSSYQAALPISGARSYCAEILTGQTL